MAAILNRPYAGTWAPNQRKIIQWTPDALVYLNGDTGLAGCPTCHHRIDIQQFVTSLSVDAGVEPGASSASITLSIPRSYGDSIFRDGNTLLRNGLEVHVYFRGYFPMVGMADPNASPESNSIAGVNLADIPQYPYYPVFHGVVTQVSHDYSGGYYSASLTCSGMLHFWQYMQIASNGAFFGARPNNSGVRTNLRGHIFTGMSPFSIIYSLYRDTMGAAAGVGFALQSRTNMQAVSTASGDSLYSLAIQYWERRFAQGMYGLRMHGASGQLFSGSTQAYLARLGGGDARILSVVNGNDRRERDPLAESAAAFNLIDRDGDGRILRGADVRLLASSGGSGRDYGVVVPQMQAFVNDISQWGQVNLFETTYESKLDIATQVSNICGYEFFQDMDGDLVFKPPLYNLDTSSSRIYRIEPEDIISISFTENEPEATWATVSGGPFQNLRGAVDEAEWGVRSTYYDYRLIAQFGWREGSLESNYYSNARSAFYAAVANLDRINQGMNSASLTIPLRAEIRPGFPVYIPHIDCFYYVQSVSHAFSFGGSCTTTLNLVARRRKFIPPGDPAGNSIESIDLGRTSFPPRSLQYLDNGGIPRILGFPNVVMALDPERINPLFFLLGLDSEEGGLSGRGGRGGIASTEARRELLASNFAQILFQAGLLGYRAVDPVDPVADSLANFDSTNADFGIDGIDGTPETPTAEVTSPTPVTEHLTREEIIGGGGADHGWWIQVGTYQGVRITAEQLQAGLTDLIAVRGRARRRIAQINREIQLLEREYQGRNTTEARRGAITNEIATLRQEASVVNDFLSGEAGRSSLDTLRADTRVSLGEGDVGITSIVNFLISEVRRRDPSTASRDMRVDGTGAINDSATLLDLLNDRKASLGLTTPGYYRYFSSAHPDPEHQGYIDLNTSSLPTSEPSGSTGETGTVAATPTKSTEEAASTADAATTEESPTTVGVEILTRQDLETEEDFERDLDEDQLRDFVKLVNKVPEKGLNVRTFASQDPTPTSTDQIFALSFEQRSATRFGSVLVFRSDTADVSRIEAAFRSCLTLSNSVGRALGRRFVERVGETAMNNAAQSCAALVGLAVAGVDNLKGGDGSLITSGDITGGVPTRLSASGLVQPAGDHVVGEGTPVGSPNTSDRATEVLQNKANALVQQVSQANEAAFNRAIRILRENRLVAEVSETPVTPTATPASASDAALSRRVSDGHGRISPEVLRATRSIESGTPANPRAIRIEYARLRGRGIDVTSVPGESPRAALDRLLREHPSQQREIMALTSFGYYQVLGNTLLRLYPDVTSALSAFDRNPTGVSDDLLVEYLNRRPVVRSAMEAVSADPSEENLDRLGRLYTGAGSVTDTVRSRSARFRAALNDPSLGRTSGASASSSSGGGGGGFVLRGEPARELRRVLANWRNDIIELFQTEGFPNVGLPFSFRSERGVVEEPINTFSPVFPVSDAVGYEHYGTYQYGRGLSIEPGGNYETLMGTDPFQYVDPDMAYDFVTAVWRSGAERGPDGAPILGPAALAALRSIASDEEFATSPGAEIAIRIFREDNPSSTEEERTAMIASGLANYIMSSRDAITHLPVSNVAFRLSDLSPFQERDTCECRGAEADLLLGAYMSGASATTFVSVDAPDRASQWTSQQMVLAADSWVLSQSALRGSALSSAGRRSVFDSVQGILGIASQLTAPAKQLESDLAGVADPSSQNLRRLNEIAGRLDRTF